MPYPSIVNLLPDPKDHVLFTRQPFTAAAPVYRKKEYQTRKMNAKVLNTLEYNKIINRLTEHATSDPGRKLCRELVPMTDLEEIQTAQMETSDALTRLFKKGSISFGSNRELGMSLKSLEIGKMCIRDRYNSLTFPFFIYIS